MYTNAALTALLTSAARCKTGTLYIPAAEGDLELFPLEFLDPPALISPTE
jgi:hypothetical protein